MQTAVDNVELFDMDLVVEADELDTDSYKDSYDSDTDFDLFRVLK